jgi:hypothetical protein
LKVFLDDKLICAMAQSPNIDDLQIEQDLCFQKRFWRMQRLGWWGMALTVLAALLGLFGSGPLSIASAGDSSGKIFVEYERFLRFNATTTLQFKIQPDPQHPTALRLWFARDYWDAFQIQQITPLPSRMQVAPNQVILIFEVAEASQPVSVSLYLSTLQMGLLWAEVGIVDGATLRYRHFVYP